MKISFTIVVRSLVITAGLLVSALIDTAMAQEIQRSVICVNGNYTAAADFQCSQTIGEPISTTFSIPELGFMAVQGFEQPFQSDVTVGLDILEWVATVYPNPTADYVFINFQQAIPVSLSLQVFGADGKFYSEQALQQQSRVDLKQLAAGTYFLRIIDDESMGYLNAIAIQKLN